MPENENQKTNLEESVNLLDTTLPTKTIDNPMPLPQEPVAEQTFDPASPNSPKLFPKWGIVLIVLSVILLLAVGIFAILSNVFSQPQNMNTTSTPTSTPYLSPTPTTIADEQRQTYVNSEYNFTFSYPESGKNPNGETITCGSKITYTPTSNPEQIVLDNLLLINISHWDNSLSNYIEKTNREYETNNPGSSLHDIYQFIPLQETGADEAIKILPKSGVASDVASADNTGFGSTGALYKKGDRLFTISGLQDYGTMEGCIIPEGSPSWRPSEFVNWDAANSLKFF